MNIKTNHNEIRIEANLATPPEKTWELLTEQRHIANWWGDHVTLEAKQSGIFREAWFDNGRKIITSGKIVVFNPPLELSLTWADDDWPGHTTATFFLTEHKKGTMLTLEHSGWGIHPNDKRQKLMNDHTTGWAHYLDQLEAYSRQV